MIITIDGPVASGKSTVARLVAQQLGFFYLNTGLLYRAVAYILFEQDTNGLAALENMSAHDFAWISQISYTYEHDVPHVTYQSRDITPFLANVAFDQPASIVSACALVRIALLGVQRRFAADHDVVADGRDCGSVIFPHADYKFYLDASVEVRARRLMLDAKRKGVMHSLDEAILAIKERDTRDMTRAVAPLRIPDDAYLIDSSALSIPEVVALVCAKISLVK